MNCFKCGAATFVRETRDDETATRIGVRRRHECFNGHRFTTVEVDPKLIPAREAASNVRRVTLARKLWARNKAIFLDPRCAVEVAKAHGLTDTRVRQIRASMKMDPAFAQPSENSSSNPERKRK